MTPAELFAEFETVFGRRKFAAGLLVAYIDLLNSLDVPQLAIGSFDEFLELFPRQTTTAAGHRANTLIVMKPDGRTTSLRPFYNEAERFYRAEMKRFDYPSAAPHATQAWADYTHWLDSLVTYSAEELAALREAVNAFVLERLVSQAFDPSSIKVEPPLFKLLLENFDMAARRGEPSGASFQGIVFGFLRADNPHLQIEIEKVRTGTKRLQRVGDVDGWEGKRLAITAEVKQFTLASNDVPDLEAFANAAGLRGALGVVAALAYAEGVRQELEEIGVIPIDRTDMVRIVELWDPLKQRTAVASFVYYASHIEKNSSLAERIQTFLKDSEETWRAERATAAESAENVATPADKDEGDASVAFAPDEENERD
ncbi:hypothetical protein [Agrobacterium pusense]|uniref:hypothetical protein n=1 Tax=Agrobacterium pusense TaxID=648995 RepID=UPI003FD45EDB